MYDSSSTTIVPCQSAHITDSLIVIDNDSKRIRPRISINASSPFNSKLNIRIHTYGKSKNSHQQVKATATIQPLNIHDEYQYQQFWRQIDAEYVRMNMSKNKNSPIYTDKLSSHRQVSLPIDQRLCLYMLNGEILARC
jgi:hypothetical protein